MERERAAPLVRELRLELLLLLAELGDVRLRLRGAARGASLSPSPQPTPPEPSRSAASAKRARGEPAAASALRGLRRGTHEGDVQLVLDPALAEELPLLRDELLCLRLGAREAVLLLLGHLEALHLARALLVELLEALGGLGDALDVLVRPDDVLEVLEEAGGSGRELQAGGSRLSETTGATGRAGSLRRRGFREGWTEESGGVAAQGREEGEKGPPPVLVGRRGLGLHHGNELDLALRGSSGPTTVSERCAPAGGVPLPGQRRRARGPEKS